MSTTAVSIKINDKPVQIALKGFSERIRPENVLKIFGVLMQASVQRTFREQGSPAGSWAPLKSSTLARGGAKQLGKLLRSSLKGIATPGRQILIKSGRLKNSITSRIEGNRLTLGTNLKYAAIHQLGGEAGRKGPFKKKDGRRSIIPARPYLVFRPEDPERLRVGAQAYIDSEIAKAGMAAE